MSPYRTAHGTREIPLRDSAGGVLRANLDNGDVSVSWPTGLGVNIQGAVARQVVSALLAGDQHLARACAQDGLEQRREALEARRTCTRSFRVPRKKTQTIVLTHGRFVTIDFGADRAVLYDGQHRGEDGMELEGDERDAVIAAATAGCEGGMDTARQIILRVLGMEPSD